MLEQCAQRDDAPFHTPGHRRGQGAPTAVFNCVGAAALRADLPELPELDNLFAPQGVIQQAQSLAAEAFGAEASYFLVNGSTAGVMAAILATCGDGDKIILPRNVHQSAIAGLILSGAMPIFVQPDYDAELELVHGLSPEAVAVALTEHPDAKAVLLVSPTYYGVVGDVAAIAHLTHQANLPLLVDEAHGAHFAFHPDLPPSALQSGADLSVQSIHKTLSALTQAAMLHLQGQRLNRDRLRQALQLVQSTSPNYLLLASLDAARQQMATAGYHLMQRTLDLAQSTRTRLAQLPGLRLLTPEQAGRTPGFVHLDPTRLTVDVSGLGLTGFAADAILHQQLGVTAELPSRRYLTFILTPGTTAADCDRLLQAFTTLSQSHALSPLSVPPPLPSGSPLLSPALPLSPRRATFSPHQTVPIDQASDRISAELICPYPPGIPALLPGELITPAALTLLQQVIASGGWVTGCADPSLATVQVVAAEPSTL